MQDQTNRVTNVKAMVLNFTAFILFALQIFAFPVYNIYCWKNGTKNYELPRLNFKSEYIILTLALIFSLAS
jgi:hypothetical protein